MLSSAKFTINLRAMRNHLVLSVTMEAHWHRRLPSTFTHARVNASNVEVVALIAIYTRGSTARRCGTASGCREITRDRSCWRLEND